MTASSQDRKESAFFRRTVTIRRPAAELFAFWRELAHLPLFMRHLDSVTVTGPETSHWVAKAPAGQTAAWDARITGEVEGQSLSWESIPGSQVENRGTVTFQPGPTDRGTEVTVAIAYAPPAGKPGQFIASLFGEEPEQQVSDDLIRFQALMETGEIPTTEGQTSGRRKKEMHS
jgi:uncharacterized membrane protein